MSGDTPGRPSCRQVSGELFSGLVQMIPYWQELGINTVELMPAYEFMEVVPPKEPDGLVSQKGKKTR